MDGEGAMMDSVRYFVALILVVGLPPGLMFWFVVHPLARFWRKLGPALTYGLTGSVMVLMMVGLFLVREPLLAIEFGTSYPLMAVAVLFLAAAMAIGLKRRKQLSWRVLVGLPEISSDQHPGQLLTDGLYARVRHPRYVEALLGVIGYALFVNYLAGYVLLALYLPLIYAVVLLEERELCDRFGDEYEEYCRRVPRFLPRLGGRT
jgi:protein-S-isoprenylcysteine O-methyltransferase Ste14